MSPNNGVHGVRACSGSTHVPTSTDSSMRPLLEMAMRAMSDRFSAGMVVEVCLATHRQSVACLMRKPPSSQRPFGCTWGGEGSHAQGGGG
jgi:hypothetical protein